MKSLPVTIGYCGLIWLFGLTHWSCRFRDYAHRPQKPEQVATAFMYALQHGHYDSAKLYATTDSHEMIDLVASIAESTPQGKKKIQQAHIIVQQVSVQDSTGYVTYFNQTARTTETFPLVLENGIWKVRFVHQLPFPDSSGTEQILPPADTSNP